MTPAAAKKKGMTQGAVSIVNGKITYRGTKVGEVFHELENGYHPVVRLRMGARPDRGAPYDHHWELDHPDLLGSIFHRVRAHLGLPQRGDGGHAKCSLCHGRKPAGVGKSYGGVVRRRRNAAHAPRRAADSGDPRVSHDARELAFPDVDVAELYGASSPRSGSRPHRGRYRNLGTRRRALLRSVEKLPRHTHAVIVGGGNVYERSFRLGIRRRRPGGAAGVPEHPPDAPVHASMHAQLLAAGMQMVGGNAWSSDYRHPARPDAMTSVSAKGDVTHWRRTTVRGQWGRVSKGQAGGVSAANHRTLLRAGFVHAGSGPSGPIYTRGAHSIHTGYQEERAGLGNPDWRHTSDYSVVRADTVRRGSGARSLARYVRGLRSYEASRAVFAGDPLFKAKLKKAKRLGVAVPQARVSLTPARHARMRRRFEDFPRDRRG
jgi:hypothetical protein